MLVDIYVSFVNMKNKYLYKKIKVYIIYMYIYTHTHIYIQLQLKLKLQYFGHLMQRTDSLERL